MTACVKNHSKRVALAISASLVGALTLGAAAPAVAFAEGAETLIATDEGEVSEATVAAAVDQTGHKIDLVDGAYEFDYTGYSQFVIPTEVMLPGDTEPTEIDPWGYQLVWMEACAPGGSAIRLGDNEYAQQITPGWGTFTQPGTYFVAVVDRGASVVSGTKAYVKFSIRDTTLDGAYVCDGADVNDKVIEYTGDYMKFGDGELGIVVDGKLRTDYSDLKVYTKGHDTHQASGAKDAGDYYVTFKLDDKDYELPFKVAPLDLSTAKIVLDGDMSAEISVALPSKIASIGDDADITSPTNDPTDGYTCKVGSATIHLDYVSGPSGEGRPTKTPVKEGKYLFRVWAEDSAGNVINEQQISVIRYVEDGAIYYGNTALPLGNTLPIVGDFNPASVTAYDRDGDPVDFGITYVKDGKVVNSITAPGDYEAIITIDSEAENWMVGGTTTVTFSVAATVVNTSEIYVTYKGESLKEPWIYDIYDGTNVMDKVAIRAIDKNDQLVPADQLVVTVTDEDGNEVEEVVEAGVYTVTVTTVEGSKYQITGGSDSFPIYLEEVGIRYNDTRETSGDKRENPVDFGNSTIRLANTMSFDDSGKDSYVYTGEAVVPTFEYDVTSWLYNYNKIEDWKALPETSYEAEYQVWNETLDKWEDVESAVEPGTYRVVLKDAVRDDSYNVWATLYFDVTDQRVFADVPNNEWYSEWVYKAASHGFHYMTGYAGTQFFGPNDSIKRGDVAVVLFKMAGGTLWADTQEGKDEPAKEYETPFSDVDESLYYAQAIQWAAKAGLVTGYDGTDEFRPEAPVSRQELAVMLARYAKMTGVDTDADLAALDAYTDGASVADFADEAVAWAVEAGVMGQDVDALRPADAISRAEVAAMTVRVQPDGRLTDGDFI